MIQIFPRLPGDENINPVVEKADLEAKVKQAELDLPRLEQQRETERKHRQDIQDRIEILKAKKPCPNKAIGLFFPGPPPERVGHTYAVTFVDSGKFARLAAASRSACCSRLRMSTSIRCPTTPAPFRRRRSEQQPADSPRRIAIGDAGVATTGPPTASGTPKPPTEIPQAPEKPITTTDVRGSQPKELEEAKTPEQPTTTEKPSEPPPVTTTDATPTDDVVILFKGDQACRKAGNRASR